MQIETPRLILRPVIEADLEMVYEYSRGPNVGPNAGWKPHESKEETLAIMRGIFIGQEDVFGIVRREDGLLFGTIGLVHDPKREHSGARMLGYAIGEPFWGQGYGTEAAKAVIRHGFEGRAFRLISAYCYPSNSRSRRVLEKLGMRYEGCLRQAEILYDGKILDNLCFSIRREEYLQPHTT